MSLEDPKECVVQLVSFIASKKKKLESTDDGPGTMERQGTLGRALRLLRGEASGGWKRKYLIQWTRDVQAGAGT